MNNRQYAENLVGPLQTGHYDTQREVTQNTYNTNWENLSNQYKNLTAQLKKEQEQANQDFAKGLVNVAGESFDRGRTANQNLASSGLTNSGITDLVAQADIQQKGQDVAALLGAAGDIAVSGAESLASANKELASQQSSLNANLGDAMGEIGGNQTATQMAYNEGLAGLSESKAARDDANARAAASRSGSSGGSSKEEEDLEAFYKQAAMAEILASPELSDGQKASTLQIYFGVNDPNEAVYTYNTNANASNTYANEMQKRQDQLDYWKSNEASRISRNNLKNSNTFNQSGQGTLLSNNGNLSYTNTNNFNPNLENELNDYLQGQQDLQLLYLNDLKDKGMTFEDLNKILYGR